MDWGTDEPMTSSVYLLASRTMCPGLVEIVDLALSYLSTREKPSTLVGTILVAYSVSELGHSPMPNTIRVSTDSCMRFLLLDALGV